MSVRQFFYPITARSMWGQQWEDSRGGGGLAGESQHEGATGEKKSSRGKGMSEERSGGGELDGCIMHRVHTSIIVRMTIVVLPQNLIES